MLISPIFSSFTETDTKIGLLQLMVVGQLAMLCLEFMIAGLWWRLVYLREFCIDDFDDDKYVCWMSMCYDFWFNPFCLYRSNWTSNTCVKFRIMRKILKFLNLIVSLFVFEIFVRIKSENKIFKKTKTRSIWEFFSQF